MRTPSQLWRESGRRYPPSPTPWLYPSGWEIVEVMRDGQIRLGGHSYWVSGALAGEPVGVIEAERRWLIYVRRTLVQAVDLENAERAGSAGVSFCRHDDLSPDGHTGERGPEGPRG